jgi:CRISPR-associated protein Cmr4
MQARLFHLHALSALHCGTGQSAGVVDLPIARARATNLPLVPGSSIRGVLREELTPKFDGDGKDAKLVRTLFGPSEIRSDQEAFSGALAIGDGHLLALPVRALAGILCYVTAPFILGRYARDRAMAGLAIPALPPTVADGAALMPSDSVNRSGSTLVLEDLDLTATESNEAKSWAETVAAAIYSADAKARGDVVTRFAVVPNDVLSFLAETATEVRARIAIDDKTGVVKKGTLWYEENLPAETLLWGVYALSGSMNEREDQRDAAELARMLPESGTLLQLGGKAGVGRGLVRLYTQEAEA